MIKTIKTFILVSLVVDVFSALYHCACAPLPQTMQVGLGVALLASLLVAPFIATPNSAEPVVVC